MNLDWWQEKKITQIMREILFIETYWIPDKFFRYRFKIFWNDMK